MRLPRLLLATAAFVALVTAAQASTPQKAKTEKQTLYYIPHTHWEGAVFYTREEYLQFGLSNLLSALRLLEKYPEYTFVLDQVAYFKPLLERYPEEAAKFRKFVKEGRLGIVGGMDVMPDDVKPGGELFVRQIQYGKDYCRKELGLDVSVAWMLDTFGHHPQMPQLLKLAGFKSFWFCRGVPKDEIPSEFNWLGIDGSTIPAVWVPGFYGLFYGPPRDQNGFDRFFTDRFEALNIHTHAPERTGLAGVDVSEPEDYVTPLVRHFNDEPDKRFKIRYSIPSDFDAVVAKRKDTPTMAGDFNPIFQGTYSSRIELKQATRAIEQKLLTAEKLGATSHILGGKTEDVSMEWRAWEPLLFNQTHDLASGTMADHVYADTVQSNKFSERLADQMIEERSRKIVARINTSGAGTPVIVYNPLGFKRSEVVEVDLGFTGPDVRRLKLVDPAGHEMSCQIESSEKYSDGSLRRVKLDFLAENVPALGYTTYHVEPIQAGAEEDGAMKLAVDNRLENEFYVVKINPKTGEITSIVDKQTGGETLSGPANVVARREDKGDLWEIYHTLDGASYIQETAKDPVPTSASALLSNAFGDKPGTFVRGPVFSEFSVSHPFGSGTFETHIRVNKGVKRVDIETTLVNNEKQVRYQVLFPTSIKNGVNTQEIPFGAVQRPVGVEYPAQNWVDFSDGRSGFALLNQGLPGNVVSDGTLMLSLLRSQSLGDYNLGHTSDSGFELGMPRTFHYSLVPHGGDWRQAGLYKEGQAFNNPLSVWKSEPHKGALPASLGAVEISEPNVVLTAFKTGADGSTVVRVYEASGSATKGVRIRLAGHAGSAVEANLLEDSGKRLDVRDGSVTVDLHPFEIKTIKFR